MNQFEDKSRLLIH